MHGALIHRKHTAPAARDMRAMSYMQGTASTNGTPHMRASESCAAVKGLLTCCTLCALPHTRVSHGGIRCSRAPSIGEQVGSRSMPLGPTEGDEKSRCAMGSFSVSFMSLAKAIAASRAVLNSLVRRVLFGEQPWYLSLSRPCLPRTLTFVAIEAAKAQAAGAARPRPPRPPCHLKL